MNALGLGLPVAPQNVRVRLDESPDIISASDAHKRIERYFVRELALVEGYASAIAVDRSSADIEIKNAL